MIVFGLTCVIPHGVAAPGNVFPNPCSALASEVLVEAPIKGFTYSDSRFDDAFRANALLDPATIVNAKSAYLKLLVNFITNGL